MRRVTFYISRVPMSSEGNVYRATWKKSGSSYVVSLTESPEIAASNDDFELACEELSLNVCENFGDGEAVLDMQRDTRSPRC